MTQEQQIQRILYYLEDDPLTGRKGIYSMMQAQEAKHSALEKRVSDIEQNAKMQNFKTGFVWGLTGFGSAAAFLWAAIKMGLIKLAMLMY